MRSQEAINRWGTGVQGASNAQSWLRDRQGFIVDTVQDPTTGGSRGLMRVPPNSSGNGYRPVVTDEVIALSILIDEYSYMVEGMEGSVNWMVDYVNESRAEHRQHLLQLEDVWYRRPGMVMNKVPEHARSFW